jgi:hypothetical protein
MEVHAVYLQKRQPDVSYRDFQRLWRSHGDYAATLDKFWSAVYRYIQNDPVEDQIPVPSQTVDYDAVGEIYYVSFDAWKNAMIETRQTLLNDEKRVFNGPSIAVRGIRTVVAEPVYGSLKLFRFANRKGDASQAQLDETVSRYCERMAQEKDILERMCGLTVTEALPTTESVMDLVFTYHFNGLTALRDVWNTQAFVKIDNAEDAIVDPNSRISVVARGWVLKNASDLAPVLNRSTER